MSDVIVQLTEEEREALLSMALDCIRSWPDKYYVGAMAQHRAALQKLRDAEPTDKERVR